MEPIDHWKAAIGAFSNVVNQVADGQWDVMVPSCPDWTVRDMVDHVAGFQRVTVGQLSAPDSINTALGDTPGASWDTIRAALEVAVGADGALDEVMESAFGTGPFGEMLMLPTIDLLFHTWDLARAIGADDTLPEATAQACYEVMLPFDDAIRRSTGAYPDGYDDKIEPPPNADAQTLLLCFGGRQP